MDSIFRKKLQKDCSFIEYPHI